MVSVKVLVLVTEKVGLSRPFLNGKDLWNLSVPFSLEWVLNWNLQFIPWQFCWNQMTNVLFLWVAKLLTSRPTFSQIVEKSTLELHFQISNCYLCNPHWSKVLLHKNNFFSSGTFWFIWDSTTVITTLCSRNFQNVKLRHYFDEVWSLHCHSDFTGNQILANSNSQKMSFSTILEILNFEFW